MPGTGHQSRNASNALRRALLAVCAISLTPILATSTGCTPFGEYFHNGLKVGPNYCTPPAPVAEHWIDADDQRVHSIDADLSHWWTAFNDPKLTELIHVAYSQNLTLREAGYRILQARYFLAIQIGNLFPQTQQAFGAYTREAVSTLVVNRDFLPQRFFNQWDLGFNMAWELDFWGRFRRAIESAQDDLDASVFQYDDVLVTLLGDVAATYVEVRTVQQQIQYVRENIKIQSEALEIAQARYRGGLTSDLDVEQAISNLAQTEALIPQFEIRLRQATDRLCVLLGIPTEELTAKLGPAPIPNPAPDVAIGIPANLLTRRPDIRAAERLAAAQCAQIGIAESDLYPQIAIRGDVGFSAERFTDLFKDHSLTAAISPGFTWNVFNYGRLVNNVRLQDAKFRELVTAYQNTVIQANAEVEDGLTEFLQSQLQARAMQRSVDAASKAVELSIMQYRSGLVDFNRVALLEQNLVQQQDLLAQAQGAIAVGLVRTYRALGGGWEIRCQPAGSDMVAEGPETVIAPPAANAEPIPQGNPLPQTMPQQMPTPAMPLNQMPMGPSGEPLLPNPTLPNPTPPNPTTPSPAPPPILGPPPTSVPQQGTPQGFNYPGPSYRG